MKRVALMLLVLLLISKPVSADEVNKLNEQNIETASQTIDKNPTGWNYFFRATLYFRNAKYAETIADCDKALELGYDKDLLYEVRAASYNNMDEYDKAIADCSLVLKRNPQNEDAYRIRAGAYILNDEYELAKADCQEALKLKPDDEEVQKLLNMINDMQTEAAQSPESVEKAFLARGYEFFQAQKFELAIRSLTKALSINPTNTVTLKLRGAVYALKREFDKAIADWQAVLKIDPSDNSVQELIDKAEAELAA